MFIIGIAGGSGAGKTTFAQKVLSFAKCDRTHILHMDSYYLAEQPKENYTESDHPNFDHPEAFDWPLLRLHLSMLKAGSSVDVPQYNFELSCREKNSSSIGPCKVLIFEGIFALYDRALRDLLDVKCFLHVDSDIRFIRRLHRDVKERGRSLESVIEQYYETVRPMYQMYLEPQRQYADFTVGEETDVAAKILAAQIKQIQCQ